MEAYVEGLVSDHVGKLVDMILIDIANTDDVARKIEMSFRDYVRRGIIPAIVYTNFPILNEHKNLPDDLQKAIAKVIREKIDLERKLLSIPLDKAYANSFKARRLSYTEELGLLKIVGQERDLNPENFWESAKEKSAEYLKTTNPRESKRVELQSEKVFAQRIDRIIKRHKKLPPPLPLE